MKNQSLSQTSKTFESIKRVSESGDEAWSARELARVLEYSDFRNFLNVIADARTACIQSGHPERDHFVEFTNMVEIGSGARRPVETTRNATNVMQRKQASTYQSGEEEAGG